MYVQDMDVLAREILANQLASTGSVFIPSRTLTEAKLRFSQNGPPALRATVTAWGEP
jgi:hypothetical protein